ncbi:MAG: MerR family DNA-binding protein [Hyphomicrobiales bacterium]|nr:MerR family DNA-binding protein [Hyphomicrobiales bacterium]
MSFIRHGRKLGLSIENTRDLVVLSSQPDMPCDEAHQIAQKHLHSVWKRFAKLKRLEKVLKRISTISDTGCVGQCDVIQSLADHQLCKSNH